MFFNIRNVHLLAISGMAAGSSAYNSLSSLQFNSTSSPSATCEFFEAISPNMTLLPSDSGYTAETEVSWDAGAWLGPACVLIPSNAEQLSFIVQNLVRLATPFAMRGGGNMPIPDAANINSTGILISSTNLKTMQLSDDQGTLSLGTGYLWGDAYIYLNTTQTGKMVVGGRYAPVGVPGYLLGGGMSFFSYEYGFSSTNGNVHAFNCVLANGTIANATADNEYSDLYWALQGGGNSFCLLTSVDLRTIDSPSIGLAPGASYGFGAETKEAWMDSILNFVVNGSSDPKAAIIPVANYGEGYDPSLGPSYGATLFYNGNNSSPAILSDFQGNSLPASNTTALTPFTMAEFSELVFPNFEPGGASHGLQQHFHVVSTAATREAMDIVHDTYFDAVLSFGLANMTGFITSLAWNAITTQFIAASNAGIGCPQGIPEEPVFWVEQSTSWADASDAALIKSFAQTVNANITAQLEAINATRAYIYLNDADQDQQVFQGYPAANLQRLKEIRNKYDPDMVFTNLMPGGFKVANA